MCSREDQTARIRQLNDEMRRTGMNSAGEQRWVLTSGVLSLGEDAMLEAVATVQTFDDFSPGNDPHGEHDFGAFSVGGEQLFWKIDYYDRSLEGHSPDPGDPAVTCRVLTIMLAIEY